MCYIKKVSRKRPKTIDKKTHAYKVLLETELSWITSKHLQQDISLKKLLPYFQY